MSAPDPYPAESRLGVQFEDLPKQEHALRFGMWLFLASEVLLFAGLFALYSAYRTTYTREFAVGIHHNWLELGTINTVVLIVSSFTVAWAVHSLRADRPRTTIRMLAVTLLLGFTFLVLKAIEYSDHFAEGLLPGAYYAHPDLPGPGFKVFFTLYFLMTGLHAIHMIVGIGVMSWLTRRVARRKTTAAYHGELEVGALYWHLVDSIWIFLWPLFYLTG